MQTIFLPIFAPKPDLSDARARLHIIYFFGDDTSTDKNNSLVGNYTYIKQQFIKQRHFIHENFNFSNIEYLFCELKIEFMDEERADEAKAKKTTGKPRRKLTEEEKASRPNVKDGVVSAKNRKKKTQRTT